MIVFAPPLRGHANLRPRSAGRVDDLTGDRRFEHQRNLRTDGGIARHQLDLGAFGPTSHDTGQVWRLTASARGYVLSNLFQGERKHLGVVDGQLVLASDGKQTWRVERRTDGNYEIGVTGDSRCLSGGPAVTLVPCTDAADQAWVITPLGPIL